MFLSFFLFSKEKEISPDLQIAQEVPPENREKGLLKKRWLKYLCAGIIILVVVGGLIASSLIWKKSNKHLKKDPISEEKNPFQANEHLRNDAVLEQGNTSPTNEQKDPPLENEEKPL